MVDRIISLIWRLRRAGRVEVGVFAVRRYSDSIARAGAEVAKYLKMESMLPSFDGYREVITDKKKHAEATEKLSKMCELINSELPVLGGIFQSESKTLETLHRYETRLERSLFRSLHELQRLQVSRNGGNVSAPVAIDIHGDFEK